MLLQLRNARACQSIQQTQPLHHRRHLRSLHLQHPQDLRVPDRWRQAHPGEQPHAGASQAPAEPLAHEPDEHGAKQARGHGRTRHSHGPAQADLQRDHYRLALLPGPVMCGAEAQVEAVLLCHHALRSPPVLQLYLHEYILFAGGVQCHQGCD